ncbi:MAG: acyl-CoA dehydrogenase family protein [Pseudomonadales bacterium]|nr:acyl-CoA dehydrogenase family protein [Pseudomonadales bacterium]
MTQIDPLTRAEGVAPVARQFGPAADRQRHLSEEVANALAAAGLYRLAMPAEVGGEAADPLTQIRVIERISRADGSAGWNLMIGIENFGLIAPAMGACADLIADPMVVLCSSTAAVGEAVEEEGGYRVSGVWQFVSGCHNSRVFGATVSVPGRRGNRYAMLTPDQYEILDTWHVGGMRGSGSHDIRVRDAFVPANRIVAPLGGVKSPSPLLRFPTAARLAYNKVAIALGLGRAAIDAFLALADGKVPRFTSARLRERSHAQLALAEAEVRVVRARAALLETVGAMWAATLAEREITVRERAILQLVCSDAVRDCVAAVELVVEAAGTSANALEHPLERIARDVRVVRQHVTVAAHQIVDAGRVLLGLPAQENMLGGLPPVNRLDERDA